jgi:hypothetical protein
MDPATDDVANTYCDLHNVTTTCVAGVWAYGLNNAGQVAGQVYNLYGQDRFAFRTAPNSTVQTADRLFPNSTSPLPSTLPGKCWLITMCTNPSD